MAEIDKLIGFMAIMQVPFMNDPDALMYIEEVKAALKTLKAQEPLKPVLKKIRIGLHTDAVRIEPYCGGCGHKLEAWYKYCPACGRAVRLT